MSELIPDVGYVSLNKFGEQLCGDHVEIVDGGDGSLVVVLFCTLRRSWGWDNLLKEANTGEGRPFPQWLRPYLKYVLPALILIVFVMGYVPKFQIWLGLA